MAKVKIIIPPVVAPPPVEVGEIDLELLTTRGRSVWGIPSPGGHSWGGHVISVPGGSLIYVPSVRAEQIGTNR